MRSLRIQAACVPGGNIQNAIVEASFAWADALGTQALSELGFDEEQQPAKANYVRMVVNALVLWTVQAGLQRRQGGWERMVDDVMKAYLAELPEDGARLLYRCMADFWPVLNAEFNEASFGATEEGIARVVARAFESVSSTSESPPSSPRLDAVKSSFTRELAQLHSDVFEGYNMWSRFNH